MSDLQRLQEVIDRAKDILSEHFDVGIIMVQSHHTGDETIRWEEPWGNALARDRHLELYHDERMQGIDVELVDEDEENDE